MQNSGLIIVYTFVSVIAVIAMTIAFLLGKSGTEAANVMDMTEKIVLGSIGIIAVAITFYYLA